MGSRSEEQKRVFSNANVRKGERDAAAEKKTQERDALAVRVSGGGEGRRGFTVVFLLVSRIRLQPVS